MNYTNMTPGRFLSRPNRFIAHVEIDGQTEVVHVKNTGRCRELLPAGAEVFCRFDPNPARKTRYDLITVRKGDRLINMDSQAPNAAAKEWLLSGGLGEIENLKFAMEDKEYRIEGTLGLWNGRHTIIPVIRKGIDAVLDCLNESDDYVIFEEKGTLKIIAYHHDGRNEFTLKEKTPKGFRSPNLWKRLYL